MIVFSILCLHFSYCEAFNVLFLYYSHSGVTKNTSHSIAEEIKLRPNIDVQATFKEISCPLDDGSFFTRATNKLKTALSIRSINCTCEDISFDSYDAVIFGSPIMGTTLPVFLEDTVAALPFSSFEGPVFYVSTGVTLTGTRASKKFSALTKVTPVKTLSIRKLIGASQNDFLLSEFVGNVIGILTNPSKHSKTSAPAEHTPEAEL
ncbi:hypothetical protein BLNAU_665 [Blattamonas nauphoetae]|uniref:Flavodoxin-like domain-containing protein n=1 Tax=Blattamonas nauphoetae TaxID=2049346 RepID=A0ABQ9YK58_9EUKA|nr:hypothetical protein BLNAU_665 [Blattamonas nauphoetae]